MHATEATPVATSRGASRWLLLLAIGLAYAIQLACFPDNLHSPYYQRLLAIAPWLGEVSHRMLLGGLGYLLAMTLFAWAAPSLRVSKASVVETSNRMSAFDVDGGQSKQLRWFCWALLGVSLALLGASMVQFALVGENAWTRWLWVGSVGFLLSGIVSCVVGEERKSFHQVSWRNGLRSPRVWVLLTILAGASWLRFHQLAAIPQDLHGDMASMGLQAREILAGAAPELFRQGWADIPMLGFYPSVVGLKWISNSIVGLNAIPALEGLLTIFALYGLMLRLFASHRLAALAATILAINIPHIHFSRLAAYMDPWPWILFGFLFLAHGLMRGRVWTFLLAGFMFGMSLQMYYSGRALIIILPVTGVYLGMLFWRDRRRQWRFWLEGGVSLSIGMVVALGPIALYFLHHPGPLFERSRSVFLFHEPVMIHLMGKYGVDSSMAVLWEQIKRSLLMFNYSHDSSTQFGFTHPLFSAFLAPLVLLGIGYSIRHWRRPAVGFGVIWLGVMLVTGSILTNNAPFWPRLVGILPVGAWMAALALVVSLQAFLSHEAASSFSHANPSTVILLALSLCLLLLGQRNWRVYAEFSSNNAHAEARIGRFLDKLPDAINACSFSTPYRLSTREIAFLAWPHRLVDLEPGMTGPLLDACPGPARVWILGPEEKSQRLRVERRWSEGQLREHRDRTGRVIFLSYLIADGASMSGEEPTPQPLGHAYLPDGAMFAPQYVFLGDVSSQVTRWRVGPVEVREEALTLILGPIQGHDAVVDYIEFLSVDGTIRRYEAEALVFEGNIQFADRPGADNRWWRQSFEPFSGGVGLVAQKNELPPALKTTIPLPAGLYDLTIGTFTGDPANAAFALGVAIQ